MKVNTYYFKARLFPTVISSIPVLVFVTQVLNPLYGESLKKVYDILPMLTSLGIYAGLVFLSVQINRFVSKEIFQRFFFKEDINMPTTNYLLWSNVFFAVDTKKAINEKILSSFNITLLNPAEEQQDGLRARNLIVHAVSQIKNKLRDNAILFQHNIEYGFIRNLIGGSLIATIFSIAIIIYALIYGDGTLRNTGVILLIIYSLPIIFSKLLITKYGRYYAKVLYEQFMSI
ncbi:MAG: hypothetical protein H7Z13_11430 [Ferruginibacter sp.]|nr:hypothetical protein [Ferruginibacter sp.]